RRVPVRPAIGQLRVLRVGAGGHASRPRDPRPARQRLPAGRVEPLRALLHDPAAGRALVGRGLLRRRRLGDPRSVTPGRGRRRRAARPGRPPARVPRFYARALRVLARRGVRLGPGETAREFLARAGAAAPACAAPLSQVTAGYERARFGAAPLSPSDLAELDRCVTRLAQPPARPAGGSPPPAPA